MKWKCCIKTAHPSLLRSKKASFVGKKSTQSTIGGMPPVPPSDYAPAIKVVYGWALPLLRPFWAQIFEVPSKIAQNFRFGGNWVQM